MLCREPENTYLKALFFLKGSVFNFHFKLNISFLFKAEVELDDQELELHASHCVGLFKRGFGH